MRIIVSTLQSHVEYLVPKSCSMKSIVNDMMMYSLMMRMTMMEVITVMLVVMVMTMLMTMVMIVIMVVVAVVMMVVMVEMVLTEECPQSPLSHWVCQDQGRLVPTRQLFARRSTGHSVK